MEEAVGGFAAAGTRCEYPAGPARNRRFRALGGAKRCFACFRLAPVRSSAASMPRTVPAAAKPPTARRCCSEFQWIGATDSMARWGGLVSGRTVRRRDAAPEPTGMYSRRVRTDTSSSHRAGSALTA